MKYLKIINEILISIVLIILIFSLIQNEYKRDIKEDVNGDGTVNSLDLLYVQQYILEKKGECKND